SPRAPCGPALPAGPGLPLGPAGPGRPGWPCGPGGPRRAAVSFATCLTPGEFLNCLADGEWRQQFYGGVMNINRKPRRRYYQFKQRSWREEKMNEGWKVFWLFSVGFAVAFGAEGTFVSDIVPVAFAD